MSFDRLNNVTKQYIQKSIIQRLEALFLDNLGKIITNDQLIQVAKDPITGNAPENYLPVSM